MLRTALMLGVVAMAASACSPHLHLAYDHGRAFTQTLEIQADLTRPSVLGATYQLYGVEAVQIRLNVQAEATSTEIFEQTLDVQ